MASWKPFRLWWYPGHGTGFWRRWARFRYYGRRDCHAFSDGLFGPVWRGVDDYWIGTYASSPYPFIGRCTSFIGGPYRLLGRRRFPSAADLWKDVGGGSVDAECRSQFAIYIGLAYGSPLYAGRTYIISCRRDDFKTLYNDDAQYDEAVGYG